MVKGPGPPPEHGAGDPAINPYNALQAKATPCEPSARYGCTLHELFS